MLILFFPFPPYALTILRLPSPLIGFQANKKQNVEHYLFVKFPVLCIILVSNSSLICSHVEQMITMHKLLGVPSNLAYVTSPFSIIKITETTEALLVLRKLLICLCIERWWKLGQGGGLDQWRWKNIDRFIIELEMTVIADRLNSQEKQ